MIPYVGQSLTPVWYGELRYQCGQVQGIILSFPRTMQGPPLCSILG